MSSSAIVEVCLRPESTAQPDAVKAHINQLLAQHGAPLRAGEELDCSADAGLAAHVRRIRVAEASSSSAAAPPHVLVHRLYDEEPAEETAAGGGEYSALVMKHSMIKRACAAVMSDDARDLAETIFAHPGLTAAELGERFCAADCGGSGLKDEV